MDVDYLPFLKESQRSVHDTATSPARSLVSYQSKNNILKQPFRRDVFNDNWGWEILCASLSVICLIALVILLKVFDKQPLPQLSYGLTFNAIISILVTVSKTSLGVAIAAGISQLKWHWYLRRKDPAGNSMLDIQLYDDASRGPWGSLVFLFTPHAWSWASIGALVTVIVLTLDPFAQQLARYPLRDFSISNSTDTPPPIIPRAETLYTGDNFTEDQQFMYHGLVSAIASSIWIESPESYISKPVCAGNICTWNEVESLAFCSSCEDKTGEWSLDGCGLQFNLSSEALWWLFANNATENRHVSGIGYDIENRCTITTTEYEPSNGNYTEYLETPDYIDELNMIHHYQQPVNITVLSSLLEDPDGRSRRKVVRPTELTYSEQAIWLVDKYYADTYASRQAAGLETDARNWTALPLLTMGSVKLQYDQKVRRDGLSIKAASLCTLTPCVKKYQVEVQNGTSRSQVDDIQYGEFYYKPYPTTNDEIAWAPLSNWTLEHSGGQNLTHVSEGPPNSTYYIDRYSMDGIGSLIEQTFAGSVRNTVTNEWPEVENKINFTFFADFDQNNESQVLNVAGKYDDVTELYVSNGALDQIIREGGLEWAMPRIADSLSRMMRDRSGISVPGQAFVSRQSVEVRWEWLILPIIAVASGIVFLALTMYICRGPDYILWKSSSLPLLYHNMERWDIIQDVHSSSHDVDSVGGMESLAKNTVTRLRRDEIDGELRFVRMEKVSRRATDE